MESKPRKKWNEQEVEKLKQMYNTMGNVELAKNLGATPNEVKSKISSMGLKRNPEFAKQLAMDASINCRFQKGHTVPQEWRDACGNKMKELFATDEEYRNKVLEASRIGADKIKGENNPNWNGGKLKVSGYMFVLCPKGHTPTHSGRYIQEHRLVMEQHLGRLLEPFEVVHHKNGIKDDNRIENLELVEARGRHIKNHAQERRKICQLELENQKLKDELRMMKNGNERTKRSV